MVVLGHTSFPLAGGAIPLFRSRFAALCLGGASVYALYQYLYRYLYRYLYQYWFSLSLSLLAPLSRLSYLFSMTIKNVI